MESICTLNYICIPNRERFEGELLHTGWSGNNENRVKKIFKGKLNKLNVAQLYSVCNATQQRNHFIYCFV